MEITRHNDAPRTDFSVTSLDVGFDLRLQGMAVDMSEVADEQLSAAGAAYDRDGTTYVVRGTRDEVARELESAGYQVIAARTANGREIRVQDGRFIVQLDNYVITVDSVADAYDAYEHPAKYLVN